ncbi:hypothetical protein SAMN04489747_3700 [Auraticoccus monumenti]|uniref:Polyketide cyclase / dehydrase and lipid transport n=2 Tax=Auraticoccus monumenti TaxID=675864 RepID=A0A1G7DSQ1_9ACTN|nr:hypothetical protein SAMN04489747_3700 [Auraticoccus monumenti]
MPPLATVDAEAFLAVPPALAAPRLADPDHQARWARGLVLHPYEDRGTEGVRAVVSGRLVGRVEWWLEPVAAPAGVQVHFWLAATPTGDGDRRPVAPGRWQRRQQRLLLEAVRRRWRAALFALADEVGTTGLGSAPTPPQET